MAGHLRHAGLGLYQVVDIFLSFARDRVGFTKDDVDRRQDQALLRRTPLRDGT